MSQRSQLTSKFSRQRITLLTIQVDKCANIYGIDDGVTTFCTATKLAGDECYNSFHTCQDKANYVKTTEDWKICTKDTTPFPGGDVYEPILDKVTRTPTEIIETKTAKAVLKFRLLNSKAVTVASELLPLGDPYVRNRSAIEGTRLRKFLTRHQNLKGRLVKEYEGALGDTFAEYDQTFEGNLWDFSQDVNGNVSGETEDLLTKMEDTDIPPRVEGKLVNAISTTDTSMTLDNPTAYPDAPNYIFMGTGETGELIKYISKSNTTGVCDITGGRGQEGTIAGEWDIGEKIKRVQWWPFQNPFDIALDILDKAGLTPFVNTSSFTEAKNTPEVDVNHSAFITEPTRARILYDELMQPLDVSTWVAEDLTVNVKRNVNIPGETVPAITEDSNIWKDTQKVNLNDAAIRNTATLAWMHTPGRKPQDELSYSRGNIYADGNSISANDRNEVLLEAMTSRFIRFGDTAEEEVEAWVAKALRRYIRRRVIRRPIIDFNVEFKDFELKTGENVELTTDKIEDILGAGLYGSLFMLMRRESGKTAIAIRAIAEPEIAYGVWAPDRLEGVSFADATEEDKRSYGAWADENGRIPDGSAYGAQGKVYY